MKVTHITLFPHCRSQLGAPEEEEVAAVFASGSVVLEELRQAYSSVGLWVSA